MHKRNGSKALLVTFTKIGTTASLPQLRLSKHAMRWPLNPSRRRPKCWMVVFHANFTNLNPQRRKNPQHGGSSTFRRLGNQLCRALSQNQERQRIPHYGD